MSNNIYVIEIDGYSYGDRLLEGVMFNAHIELDVSDPTLLKAVKVIAPKDTESYLKDIGGDGAVDHWCNIILSEIDIDQAITEPLWESRKLTLSEMVALYQYEAAFGIDDDETREMLSDFGYDDEMIERIIASPSNGIDYSVNVSQKTGTPIKVYNANDVLSDILAKGND